MKLKNLFSSQGEEQPKKEERKSLKLNLGDDNEVVEQSACVEVSNELPDGLIIDGVVITDDKNLYDTLGFKKGASIKKVDEAGKILIGEIVSKYNFDNNRINLYKTAYRVLSSNSSRKSYAFARKNKISSIKLSNGQVIDASVDYFKLLGVSEKANNKTIAEAFKAKVGAYYLVAHNSIDLDSYIKSEDVQKIMDIEDAHAVLSNKSNKAAYDAWMKNNNKKSKKAGAVKVTNVEDGMEASKKGNKILKGIAAGAIALGILLSAGTVGYLIGNRNSKRVPDEKPGNEVVEPTLEPTAVPTEEPVIETREFYDVNDSVQMEKRAAKNFAMMQANGINFQVPNEDGNGLRDVNENDILALQYWANYQYLNQDNIEKACDMDTAAMLMAQICINYDNAGDTSKRLVGITGLEKDENAGKYNFDLGQLFIDDSVQQKELSKVCELINNIKNKPVAEDAKCFANELYEKAMLHFIFDDQNMGLHISEYDTANFAYGMTLVMNQSMFNLQPYFVMDNATYNNYGAFIDTLNSVDGPLNMLGRSIDKDMANCTLKLQ